MNLTPERIVARYREQGALAYEGEGITQLQHAWQCGQLAAQAGVPAPLQLAAWLHDLGHLLTGERDNPTLSLLEVLADVFAVPVSYFSDDYLGRVTNDLLPLLAAVADPNVRALLHRSDLPDVAAVLGGTEQITATPQLTELLSRPDLQAVAEDLTHRELLAWLGDRPLADVLATLRAPVVQSAVEETLANWLKYGSGR